MRPRSARVARERRPRELRDHVLVLRVWRPRAAGGDEAPPWRCALEDTRTGQRRGFASPRELLTYLETALADLTTSGKP